MMKYPMLILLLCITFHLQAQVRLDVQGEARATGNYIELIKPSNNAHFLRLSSEGAAMDINATTDLYLSSGGNINLDANNASGKVGVGTANPMGKFHVVGDRIRISTPGDENRYIDFRTDGNHLDINPVGADLYIDSGANDLLLATQTGKVGIGIEVPQSKLHIAGGTIRIDNIPTGTGDAVLIDPNGDLVIASSASNLIIQELQTKIETLEAQLTKIEHLLQQMTKHIPNENKQPQIPSSSKNYLQQNYPNPSNNSTIIPYFIPDTVKQATLLILDAKGIVVQQFPIKNRGKGQVHLDHSTWQEGTHTYSLILDGMPVDSRRMVLTKE